MRRSRPSDWLLGLKENVIIGKLIPAGTGIARYRNIDGEADRGSSGRRVHDPVLRGSVLQPGLRSGLGQAVPLDDYGYSDYR